jgi:hypothetical protein
MALPEPACYINNKTIGVPLELWDLEKEMICAPGYFCPNTTISDPQTFPRICPATPECVMARLKGAFCSAQGKYDPIICPAGFYCPSSLEMLKCPENNFW